jgi:hypothetical protein
MYVKRSQAAEKNGLYRDHLILFVTQSSVLSLTRLGAPSFPPKRLTLQLSPVSKAFATDVESIPQNRTEELKEFFAEIPRMKKYEEGALSVLLKFLGLERTRPLSLCYSNS